MVLVDREQASGLLHGPIRELACGLTRGPIAGTNVRERMGEAKRIALGMSGGLDSSVAVAVLQQQGYDVVGVTCVFLADAHAQDGAVEVAVEDARAVCERFGIPHVVRHSEALFEEKVVAPFVNSYACGLTPSPCVGCNAHAKIPELLAVADEIGCDYVATGHYARVIEVGEGDAFTLGGGEGDANETAASAEPTRYAVAVAADPAKDQSYMLASLPQEQLARLVLPLGDMTKQQVREIARELGFVELAEKPESQDICFAPQGYTQLLSDRGVGFEPGPIVLDGAKVGMHEGLAKYTFGQRKGIGVAGPEPYYVVGKDVAANELHIAPAEGALVSSVLVGGLCWQALESFGGSKEAAVKLRYRSHACPCIIERAENARVLVRLGSPQPATAPGQYAVFYDGSTVLGGGVIEEVNR